MRCLVTGGAGFIGSNLALSLEGEREDEVIVVDDFSVGHFKNLTGFGGDIISCGVQDSCWWDKAGKVDIVFHQAAITDTTVEDQKKMMMVNVDGFRSVLDFAVKYGVKKIVYASSAAVYGNGNCPMHEEQKLLPENIYGFSKVVMDNLAKSFSARHKDFVVVGLRYFNVYGPGEYHKGAAASMIYQLYMQIKSGKRPRIFKFGEQMRDFVYVKDVVRANLNAADAGKSCVVNVASGRPGNFNRVIECLNSAMGTNLEPEYFDNPYSFYQNKTHADLRKAKAFINYRPQWSLEEGIRDYVNLLEGKKQAQANV